MIPLADRLRAAAAGLRDEHITLGLLMQAHGPAAQGSLLLLLAVPCMLPVPGTGTVLGIGVLAVALALWRGDGVVQLPPRVAALPLSPAWARRVLNTLAAIYALAAGRLRARLEGVLQAHAMRAVSAATLAMAVLLILPIPFGNVLPAVALILFGLGLAFRDGLAVLLGLLTSAITLLLMALLAVTAFDAAGWLARGIGA